MAVVEFDFEQAVYPRDLEHRFRLYAWRGDRDYDVLCAAPTMAGIGNAIQSFHEDQKQMGETLGDLGRTGILDTCPGGEPAEHGEWIVLPFDRGS